MTPFFPILGVHQPRVVGKKKKKTVFAPDGCFFFFLLGAGPAMVGSREDREGNKTA